MNIRMPGELSGRLEDLQDEYLQEELKTKGVVTLADILTIKEQFGSKYPFAEKISLWQGDITRLKVGAIVNAAWNESFLMFLRTVTEVFTRRFWVDLALTGIKLLRKR